MMQDYAAALDNYRWALDQYANEVNQPVAVPYPNYRSNAEKPFDDYYCRPIPGNPYVYDCMHESYFGNTM